MSRFTPKQLGIIILTVLTALIHLFLGFNSLGDGFFGVVFILNGLGYLALLIGLYFLPQLAGQRPLLRWALLAFTAVTFILYFVFNWPDIWGPIGIADKAIELVLLVLLWLEK